MDELQHLVELAQNKDTHAFGEIYEMVYRDLYRYALYYLGNREDACDAVQDTALEAYLGLGKLRNANAFRVWIFRILCARCKRIVKFRIVRRGESNFAEETEVSDENLDIDAILDIKNAIDGLKDDERQIILLSLVQDMKSAEIADILGIPEGTARSKKSRAMEKLRRACNELG